MPRGAGGYSYWPDGSLKSDENKEVSLINYDSFLKLPTEIWLSGGRWIKMYYNGAGQWWCFKLGDGEISHLAYVFKSTLYFRAVELVFRRSILIW